MKEQFENSYLFGGNAPFVEELYEAWLENAADVPESWRQVRKKLDDIHHQLPAGVQGRKPESSPSRSFPTLTGWKPSTSFCGETAANIVCSRICGGSGAWTKIPWIWASAFRRAINVRSSCSVHVSVSTMVSERMPSSSAFLCFLETYARDAGSSPTRTNVTAGRTPRDFSAATLAAVSLCTSSAMATPSRACSAAG